MEPFQEGEWVVLHQLNKKKLARIGRKGFTTLGKDFVSLEGAIGCLPWTSFKMEPHSGPKSGKRAFQIVPLADDNDDYDDVNPHDHNQGGIDEEDRDNRTINDDGQSQSLSAVEIEALREGGLTGKEIVNHLVANSSTYDKKTRYAKSKYLKKKESKHCLREKLSIRRTTLSSVAEVLCSGGGGEGSRGSISGMRPDTLSQMLTALNIQWKRIPSIKQTLSKKTVPTTKNRDKSSVCVSNATQEGSMNEAGGTVSLESAEEKGTPLVDLKKEPKTEEETVEDTRSPVVNMNLHSGTTYVVYESGNWGLLVASLLNLLPANGPKLIHLYPGHGVPCLIAPRALNLCQEKLSLLSSVNFKALLESLVKSVKDTHMDEVVVKIESNEDLLADGEGNSEAMADQVFDAIKEQKDALLEENNLDGQKNQTCDNSDKLNNAGCESRKRKMETGDEVEENESTAKKPRWQLEAEIAANVLTSRKMDGLVVVASREHPVTIVLSLLSYLAPSRPLVVYCPHREPLLDLYAVLKGWEPWSSKYGKCGGKDGIPRVVNLRVVENWLRNYQVLPNRTHPEVNMIPGGGFVLTGTVIDFGDE